MNKSLINTGPDYTYMMLLFRDIVMRTKIKPGENLIFTGCVGACYSMATYFAFAIRDMGLNLFYAPEADIKKLRALEFDEEFGIAATRKVKPVKARVAVIMSGLCRLPVERVVKFIKDSLEESGQIIGQGVVPGIYEKEGWDKQIRFNYLFEYTIKDPTTFKVM